jgi:hypothetical protein
MGDGVENGVEGKRRLVKMMSGKSAEAGKDDGWKIARKLVRVMGGEWRESW